MKDFGTWIENEIEMNCKNESSVLFKFRWKMMKNRNAKFSIVKFRVKFHSHVGLTSLRAHGKSNQRCLGRTWKIWKETWEYDSWLVNSLFE